MSPSLDLQRRKTLMLHRQKRRLLRDGLPAWLQHMYNFGVFSLGAPTFIFSSLGHYNPSISTSPVSMAPVGSGSSKVTSPDRTCGPAKNYICPIGKCCSASGYCGNGDYCFDPDCQSQYAACDASTKPAGSTTKNDP